MNVLMITQQSSHAAQFIPHLQCCQENSLLRQKIKLLEQSLKNAKDKIFSLKENNNTAVVQLKQHIQELEDQKEKNSTNSSKPSSTDGYGKPPLRVNVRKMVKK